MHAQLSVLGLAIVALQWALLIACRRSICRTLSFLSSVKNLPSFIKDAALGPLGVGLLESLHDVGCVISETVLFDLGNLLLIDVCLASIPVLEEGLLHLGLLLDVEQPHLVLQRLNCFAIRNCLLAESLLEIEVVVKSGVLAEDTVLQLDFRRLSLDDAVDVADLIDAFVLLASVQYLLDCLLIFQNQRLLRNVSEVLSLVVEVPLPVVVLVSGRREVGGRRC